MRAGTERLKMRGEHVEVEIPQLEKEMDAVARLLGPEAEFRREFRKAARDLAKRRETVTSEKTTERVLGEQRTVRAEATTEGGEGEFTQVPLSGVAARLEKIVTDALQTRGMTEGEAAAAVGRVKAAAVKAKREGGDVKIGAGGTTTERVTETIKQRAQIEKETVKEIIENLGINKAQKAALHAYYDAISRAGAKAKKIEVGDQVFRIEPVMDIESGLERAEALKPLLDAGFTVEGREGNKMKLFRDSPEEVRTAPLGEPVIKGGKEIGKGRGELRAEPGYVAAKGIAQLSQEVATRQFFRTVADNPEWTSKAERPGFTRMLADEKKLGDLADKFVRSDIASEINEAIRIKGDMEKISERLTSLWKIGKVFNPATIARNIMTSVEVMKWGGLSYARPSGIRSYERTIMGLAGKDPEVTAWLDKAKKGGMYRSTWNQGEISALADGFIVSKETNPLLRILDGVQSIVNKSKAPQIYGSVDNFLKSAMYVHLKSQGLSDQLALRGAKKWGIDYGDISPFVRTMRKAPLGSPFITWSSKVIPLAIETMIKHPVRFWSLPALLWGVHSLSKSQFDQQEIESIQNLGNLKPLRHVLLPGKSEEGRNRFLDLGYNLPFGDVLEAYDHVSGGKGGNVSFAPLGGWAQPFMELGFNHNLFTGKPIWLETDTYKERYAKISDHMLKGLLPAWAPPVPGTGFRGGYTTEAFRKAINPEWQGFEPMLGLPPLESPISKTDFLGRQRGMMATVASKVLGINITEVSLKDLQLLGLIEFQQKANELSRQMTRFSLMEISDKQKQAQLEKLNEKYEVLNREIKEKFSVGVRPPTSPSMKRPTFKDDLGIFEARP